MRTHQLLGTLTILGLAACAGDGTGLGPDGNTLPTATTLSGDVQPIFTANCALSGCHAGAAPQLGQNLSAGNAYTSIVNVASVEVPSLLRVEPGDPDNSYLVHKIEGTAASVGGVDTRMPLGNPPLSASEIATIRAWIEEGALNN